MLRQMMPDFSKGRKRISLILTVLAVFFIVIGLANPQMGSKMEKIKRQGVDIMIAIDVSRSMLADDVQPSRLDRAKQIVSQLVDRMANDRVGLIVFAGEATLQMPLTVDYAAAKLFLRTVDPDVVGTQGTAISQAINVAHYNFVQEEEKHKALILITDGEDHEAGAIVKAQEAFDDGVVIYTMGIGSADGARIPVYRKGKKMGYLIDENGQEVISKLDEGVLREIAEATNGQFFRVQGASGEIAEIISELGDLEKKEFEDRVFTDYEDQFQYFIFFGFLLLLIEFFLSEKSKGYFSGVNLFGERKRPIEE